MTSSAQRQLTSSRSCSGALQEALLRVTARTRLQELAEHTEVRSVHQIHITQKVSSCFRHTAMRCFKLACSYWRKKGQTTPQLHRGSRTTLTVTCAWITLGRYFISQHFNSPITQPSLQLCFNEHLCKRQKYLPPYKPFKITH